MKLTDQQRSVLSLSLITLISNASFSTIAPILPLECDAYQISEQWLSLIFLAYPVGFCVAAPLIAKWFEVVGTVQIMIWGMRSVGSIFLCMSFVFSFDAPSHLRIALLTMGQFSLGASMSTVSTGYYSLATLICSDQEKAMSYIESAVGLGERIDLLIRYFKTGPWAQNSFTVVP
jgi:MFS family permease